MKWRVAKVVLAVLILASPALAYRREYAVMLDGQRKSGSEVCFYRGESAADAFSLFFTYGKVACLPADQVLDLPAGLFHVFARHPGGYVSGHRDFFVHNAPARAEIGYDKFEIPLEQAAYADMTAIRASLEAGQTAGVWLAPTADTAGTYFPLVDGETIISVPAGKPFVPMIVANKAPVAIGRRMLLPTGETQSVSITATAGVTDVLAWVKLDRAAGEPSLDKLDVPQIVLVAGEERVPPLFASTAIPSTHTLIFFKDVPPGPARIEVRGKTWLHYDREIVVQANGVTVERIPLLLTPAASLELSWNSGIDSPDTSDCATDKVPRPRITVTLSHCPDQGDDARCPPTERRSETFTAAGSVQFEGIAPGRYKVAINTPVSNPAVPDVELSAGTVTSLVVPVRTFVFFGTVKLNGEPLRGRLLFVTGEALSDAAGIFTATLAADPLGNLIDIVACADGRTFRYIPDEKIRENTAHDIDLHVRPLNVSVFDPSGTTSVGGASVTFTPVDEIRGGAYYTSPPLDTDKNGRVQFPSVPTDKALLICAKHAAYSPTCSDPLSPKVLADGKTVLRFKGTSLRGRVAGHVGTGWLTLVDNFGRITEETSLRADGTFSLQSPHTHLEHAVYVSDRRSLTVFPLPPESFAQTEMLLTLPNVTARSFTVSVNGMKSPSGFVGVWVDGRYVPLQVLVVHQELRGRDVSVYRGRTLTILDIAETAPIMIAYAPEIPASGDFVDPFTLPQYAGVNRFRVTSQTMTLEARE